MFKNLLLESDFVGMVCFVSYPAFNQSHFFQVEFRRLSVSTESQVKQLGTL